MIKFVITAHIKIILNNIIMIDKNAVKYIGENKIQACRDLESAKILLLSPNPHLENVAFLLEQSYEKILKASYARYKLETTSNSWEKVYKTVYGHDINFMFEMLRSIHQDYGKLIAKPIEAYTSYVKLHHVLPEKIEKMINSHEKIVEQIMKGIDQLEQDVRYTTKNNDNFVKFLSQLNSKSIKETNIERTNIPLSLDIIDDLKNKIPNVFNSNMLDIKTLQKYTTFLNMLKALAPYALPHIFAGRYPLKECKMENLKAYRNSLNLKEFFDVLAYKIQMLLDSEADFTGQIIKIHLASSNMSKTC